MCQNELTVKFWTYCNSEYFVGPFPVGGVTYIVNRLLAVFMATTELCICHGTNMVRWLTERAQ
jgi:hypothetical protein